MFEAAKQINIAVSYKKAHKFIFNNNINMLFCKYLFCKMGTISAYCSRYLLKAYQSHTSHTYEGLDFPFRQFSAKKPNQDKIFYYIFNKLQNGKLVISPKKSKFRKFSVFLLTISNF